MVSALPGAIGRYQVRRELGRGMMGVVYLANDPDLGRDIALKVIQVPAGANEAVRAEFEQRFFSEAKSAARLSHPGIVTVHDVGRDPVTGSLYMALQLLPGQTLDHLLKEKKRLDCDEALRIIKQVAAALQHAHSEGVVHRDIKPANIMILPSGEPKVMDFGIAKIEASSLTATGKFLGTPLYMSPEQAMARPVDGRSDLFSLGSVLYEMLTGVPAFAGESVTKILFQLMSIEPTPPSKVVATLPGSVDKILNRCLAKDVERRYNDAETLARDIGDILEARKVGGLSPSPPPARFTGTVRSGTAPATTPLANPDAAFADWSAVATRALPAAAGQIPRRAIAVAAGVLALGGFGWLLTRGNAPPPVARLVAESPTQAVTPAPSVSEPSPSATPDPNEPAQLIIDFEHSLKSGVLRVFVDDLLIVDQAFGGRVTRSVVGLEMRKGRLTRTLEVAPGRRDVRVQVSWDDNVKTEGSQTVFNPGRKLRLKAKLGSMGGLRKNLSLEWN